MYKLKQACKCKTESPLYFIWYYIKHGRPVTNLVLQLQLWYKLKVHTLAKGTSFFTGLQLSFKLYHRPVKFLIIRSVTGLYTSLGIKPG